MGNYKYKQFMARMNLNTYDRLKKVFPSEKGESAASYFNRLAVYLETLTEQFGDYLK